MAGQGHVLLHLVEVGGHDHRQRVLLAIHGALLQGREHFREGHGRGDDAQALVGGHVHRVLHGAHLQALEVIGLVDGALVVGHVTHAVLRPGQGLEALGLELRQQLLTNRPVQYRTGVGLVAEQEGHVQDAGLGHEIRHRASGVVGQLLRAQLHRLHHLALTTQRARVEVLDDDTTVGALFHLAGQRVHGLTRMGVLRHRDGVAHGDLLRNGGGGETQGQSQGQQEFAWLHLRSPHEANAGSDMA